MGRQELERHNPPELGVLGFVNHTHPTLAELGEDFAVTDGRADHDGQIVPPLGLVVRTGFARSGPPMDLVLLEFALRSVTEALEPASRTLDKCNLPGQWRSKYAE